MISNEGAARLARFQGVPEDVLVNLHEPSGANGYAYEIVLTRGCLMVRYIFIDRPSLGEIAKAFSDLLGQNEWLR